MYENGPKPKKKKVPDLTKNKENVPKHTRIIVKITRHCTKKIELYQIWQHCLEYIKTGGPTVSRLLLPPTPPLSRFKRGNEKSSCTRWSRYAGSPFFFQLASGKWSVFIQKRYNNLPSQLNSSSSSLSGP